MRRRRRHSIDSEIPTSSTGDIAFLLIIFFMVTASFAVTKGLPFDLPPKTQPEGDDTRPSVLIEIAEDGTITVDCRRMDVEQILDYLESKLTRDPTKPIVVYAHEGSRYRHLVAAYEVLFQIPERGLPEPNVRIPTPDVIEGYIRTFGVDPFQEHCAG